MLILLCKKYSKITVFDLDGKQNDSEKSNNLKMNRESDGNKKPATFVRRTLPINT